MKCPSCSAALPAAVPRCPACKFSLRIADRKFGAPPRRSTHVTDYSKRLSGGDVERLRDELTHFEHRFPQIRFSVVVTELSPGQSAGEYAFWLANRVPSGVAARSGTQNLALLLVLDLTTNAAAFAAGYGLEAILAERDLAHALKTMTAAYSGKEFTDAISIAISQIADILRELAVQNPREVPVTVSSHEK